jgi:hypothetical protein
LATLMRPAKLDRIILQLHVSILINHKQSKLMTWEVHSWYKFSRPKIADVLALGTGIKEMWKRWVHRKIGDRDVLGRERCIGK